MPEFRIVEIKQTNTLGQSYTMYRIQKKFILWWYNARIRTGYYLGDGNPESRMFLRRRNIPMNDITQAELLLAHFYACPFQLYYRNNRIEKILYESDWNRPLYVNLSKIYADGTCQCSFDMKELQRKIDRDYFIETRKIHKKTNWILVGVIIRFMLLDTLARVQGVEIK